MFIILKCKSSCKYNKLYSPPIKTNHPLFHFLVVKVLDIQETLLQIQQMIQIEHRYQICNEETTTLESDR